VRLRLALAAAAALLLSACDEGASTPEPPPSPLFYEIADAGGQPQGWLLGTIHALPDGVAWRTAAVDAAADQADLLVLEVARLDDSERHATLFARLAEAPTQPPLSTKVDPALHQNLDAMLEDGGRDADEFARTDTWATALTLAQAIRYGDGANGVERTLVRDFTNRPIEELEGVARQLAMFDALPEQDQRDMLAAIVASYPEARADPGRLARVWLAGDEAALEAELKRGILADPELYEALLARRNRAWAADIAPLLEAEPRPLIAVGAAHLVGPDGLATLLRERGYTLTRVR